MSGTLKKKPFERVTKNSYNGVKSLDEQEKSYGDK